MDIHEAILASCTHSPRIIPFQAELQPTQRRRSIGWKPPTDFADKAKQAIYNF